MLPGTLQWAMGPHAHASAVGAAVFGVTVVVRVVDAHLTSVVAFESRKATAHFVADANTRLVTRKTAARLEWIIHTEISVWTVI
jgi:hypothetical protein